MVDKTACVAVAGASSCPSLEPSLVMMMTVQDNCVPCPVLPPSPSLEPLGSHILVEAL
mgnify:CR=1 FL=1